MRPSLRQRAFCASQASISGKRAALTRMRSWIAATAASTSPRDVGARFASAYAPSLFTIAGSVDAIARRAR